MIDTLIHGGDIIDGTGSPRYQGDVVLKGDRIADIGRFPHAQALSTIDATNKVVCPGFIDVHVHSELAMLADRHSAGVLMGVTTEFIAPDGFSYAPRPPERLSEYRAYLGAFYGDADVGWDWTTFAEYLQRFDKRIRNNLVSQVPHGAVRLAVVGWAEGPASDGQLDVMCRLTRVCMEAGAVGLSTGLAYTPSAHADLREQIELCKVVAEYGGVYAVHLRSYADEHRDSAIAECVAVTETAGIGLHISHFSGLPETYAKAEAERSRGIDVTWDAYPYSAGCTWLAYPLPSSLLTTNVPGIVQKLRSRQIRRSLQGPFEERYPPDGAAYFASLTQPHNKWMEGKRLREVWRDSRGPFEDFVCDLLVDEQLRPLVVVPWPGTPEETEVRVRHTLTHPHQMVATDGVYIGGSPHPRGWGTYPRILGSCVRDKRWLLLEDAVRRMTGFPAHRFGLSDRGLLRRGMAADLVVFDPKTVRDRATFESPRVPPVGIEQVFVNAVQVVDRGRLLDTRPGRVLCRHDG